MAMPPLGSGRGKVLQGGTIAPAWESGGASEPPIGETAGLRALLFLHGCMDMPQGRQYAKKHLE